MAKLEEQFTIRTSCTKDAAQEAVVGYLSGIGAKMKSSTSSYVEATTGSQAAIRGKGAAFTDSSQYPLRVTASFTSRGTGSTVAVKLSDALGVGFRLGMKKGYTALFEARRKAITSAVESARTPVQSSPDPSASTLASELADLAKLHESGVLSDDEFVSAKARLIAE